jgi:PD-(D/E)XK nuclease superfamily
MNGDADSHGDKKDLQALEHLVVGNEDLERLEALLDQFNIFEAIGVVNQELRHSDFLAYLLDPRGNHDLRDAFIKRLLQRAIITAADTPMRVTPIELELWNLDRIDVRREWERIDVLVLDEEHELAVIIENKIGSGEHSDQLERYYRTVEQQYPGYRVIGLYLTPDGEPPSHEVYLPINYGLVSDIIEGLAGSRASSLSPDLRILMNHYTEMLRRHIVSDSEIARLCRQIYRQHRHAIDLVYEHRPDRRAEMRQFLEHLIRGETHLVLDVSDKYYIRFIPKDWDQILSRPERRGQTNGPRQGVC